MPDEQAIVQVFVPDKEDNEFIRDLLAREDMDISNNSMILAEVSMQLCYSNMDKEVVSAIWWKIYDVFGGSGQEYLKDADILSIKVVNLDRLWLVLIHVSDDHNYSEHF